MAKFGIIGGGAFGTAMACVLRRSGHEVTLWAREPDVVASINRESVNSIFLPGVNLQPGITATGELSGAAAGKDIVLTAVPAQHLREVSHGLRAFLGKGTPVVSCSKGIERSSGALMPQVLAETLPDAKIAVLSGPSFAHEIAIDLPCSVDLACADLALARSLARQMCNPHFCVRPCDDVISVAMGGVMKNVIAIASGVVVGRKLGENARASLVTLGLAEACRLAEAMGGKAATFSGPSGMGDLMLTANSMHSRNTSLGLALGHGRALADILAERMEVTEGAFSVEAIAALARRFKVNMPITFAVDEVLNRNAGLDGVIVRLMAELRAVQSQAAI